MIQHSQITIKMIAKGRIYNFLQSTWDLNLSYHLEILVSLHIDKGMISIKYLQLIS